MTRLLSIAKDDEVLLKYLWLYWIKEDAVFKFCKEMISVQMSESQLKKVVSEYLDSAAHISKESFNSIAEMLWKKHQQCETLRVVLDAVTDNIAVEPTLTLEDRLSLIIKFKCDDAS